MQLQWIAAEKNEKVYNNVNYILSPIKIQNNIRTQKMSFITKIKFVPPAKIIHLKPNCFKLIM